VFVPQSRRIRLLAAVVGCLMLSGVGVALAVHSSESSSRQDLVTTGPTSAPVAPTSFRATTTTMVPLTEAAVTTSAPPVTTHHSTAPATTLPSRPPTTVIHPTTTTPTAPGVTTTSVILQNQYPAAAIVTINGIRYNLASGQQETVTVTPAPDHQDGVEVHRVDDPSCGRGGTGLFFIAGSRITLQLLVMAPSGCGTSGGPSIGYRFSPASTG
jgi:hypothetical protein